MPTRDSRGRSLSVLGALRAALFSLLPTRKSVSGKLTGVVMMTTAIALLVAGTAMLFNDVEDYRESWTSDLSTQADILALSTAPALAFDDERAAERNLAALAARPAVLAAAAYGPDGSLYANYVRPGEEKLPVTLPMPQPGTNISGERVEVSKRVVQGGEVLGTIYLRARYNVTGRVYAYLSIFGLVMLMSMGVALVWSAALRKVITTPLDAMASVAHQIVDGRDYSIRAEKTSEDEIGVAVEAFNSMLDEVQTRNRALEQSNAALTGEVNVRLAAEASLERANARLESSMAAAEIGSWLQDLQTGELTTDHNLCALYGVSEADLKGDPTLLRRQIHPDDVPAVDAAEAAALDSGILPSTEFRIVRNGGEIRWVARRGKVHFDADGAPMLLAGLLIDITAQKEAEKALRESEKLYRAIGESIDYGVWLCDASGRNVYASESFLRLTGITQEQCSHHGWGDLLHPDDVQATMAAWQECVKAGAIWYREHRIRGADGRYYPVLAQGVPIKGESGSITGWAGINLDISRLKQTEEALREEDRRKDEFLATLAHELRNPLAPISHAVKLLDIAGSDEQQRQWGREVISRQVKRMALLLDDLLDVSRITRGRLELRRGYIDLASLVASAIETARPLIDAKQHTLEVHLPADPVELEVDPLRLSQALSNLLTNAAKYTDAGGRVTVAAALSADSLRISVKDTGIGFNREATPKLFEMFSQIDSGSDRAEGGLGIGLALVKGLVALHGGTVHAESGGIGKGSEFTLDLPRSVVSSRKSGAHERSGGEFVSAGPRGKVLVTDDNVDAAEALALVLRFAGHEVSVAHSGPEALETGARERPSAVILDIGLPGMSGYDVARQVRSEAWGRHVLLVALTGWGQGHDKERARAAGFDHHLTKPADPDHVEQLISAFMRENAANRPAQNKAAPASADRGKPG